MGNIARIERIYVETLPDESPDVSWLEQDYNEPSITPAEALRYRARDAERLAVFNAGDWHMIGVRLAADVILSREGRVDEMIKLTTPGVWNVESDSDEGYAVEIADGELDYLVDDLVALGFARDLVQVRIAFDLEPDRVEVV